MDLIYLDPPFNKKKIFTAPLQEVQRRELPFPIYSVKKM